MDEERIQLTLEESGERIDALLARTFPDLSRSLIQKCIEAGDLWKAPLALLQPRR